MFTITLHKAGLRRVGAVALCAAVLAGAAVLGHNMGAAVPASASAAAKIETAQDVVGYFAGFGLEADPSGVSADKVKIPRRWDDSFSAFNTLVAQSGLDLAKYKGKTVEKWVAPVPLLSSGEETAYAVLLVYKKKAVGAYVLKKPSGAVTGLVDAMQAQAASAEAQVDALTDGAGESLEVALNTDLVPDPEGYPVE